MTHRHYADLPRRRLVDLCVQREALLCLAADALTNPQRSRRGDVADMIYQHVRQVRTAADIRRGVSIEDPR